MTNRRQSKIKLNKFLLIAFILLVSVKSTYCQYKLRYDNDYLTTLNFGPGKKDGFNVSISLVAIFTSGVSDRNGLRLGAGLTIYQTISNWTISSGFDTYKAKQKFGLGTTFAGIIFDDGKYGGSYYVNKYHQGEKQISGIVSVHLDDFSINFEDDILAFPFTDFKIYDRYRTAALEIRYKKFMIGTNVYTTDINGITDISYKNPKGVYSSGKQISSPIYAGFVTNGILLRTGFNSKTGGWVGQNGWHRHLFGTPDFIGGNNKNPFIQFGIDKPYTLY